MYVVTENLIVFCSRHACAASVLYHTVIEVLIQGWLEKCTQFCT